MKKKPATEKPQFRVTFARIERGEDGSQTVGRPKEIGAIWPRKNGKKGGILALDIIPIELTRREGVIFILPIEQDNGGSA